MVTPDDLYGPMAAGASLLLITSKLAMLRCWVKTVEAGVSSCDRLSIARPAGMAARMMDSMAVGTESTRRPGLSCAGDGSEDESGRQAVNV